MELDEYSDDAPPAYEAYAFSFEPRMLHDAYRDVLEDVDSLGSYVPCNVASNNNNNNHQDDMAVETSTTTTAAPVSKTSAAGPVVANPPAGSIVHTLFHYLDAAQLARVALPYDEAVRALGERYAPVLQNLERLQLRERISAMLLVFARRMLLGALARDEHGARISQLLQRLDELYLVWDDVEVTQGRLDWAHGERVDALLQQVTRDSLEPATDAFYAKCADVRKRGRKPGSEKENPPHALNRLKAEYIESQKTVPPVQYNAAQRHFELAAPCSEVPPPTQLLVNYYPMFVQVLTVYNGLVPRRDNHGWFTERVRRAARLLQPAEWPLHGLVCALLNLRAVLSCTRVRLERADMRCAYSGQPIAVNEEVTLLRLLVHSPALHRVWVRDGQTPLQPHSDEALARCVRCFVLKTRVCALASLFAPPLPEAYRRRHASYFGVTSGTAPTTTQQWLATKRLKAVRTLPINRRYCCNTLWCATAQLLRFVGDNQLAPLLWEQGRREPLQARLDRMPMVWQSLTVDDDARLDYALFTSVLSRASVEELTPQQRAQEARLQEYLEMTRDVVLDWLDLCLPPVAAQASDASDGLCAHSFPIEALQLRPDEETKAPLVQPQMRDGPLVRALMAASDRRATVPESERRTRLQRLLQHVAAHPFLFLSLHDACFARCDALPALQFPAALRWLRGLGVALDST